MKKSILTVALAFSMTALGAELIPGYQSSGSQTLDKALYRLHQMYHAADCTSVNDSYEYVAPLLTEALEQDPGLVEYLMGLHLAMPISELHLKDLFEYQLAKVVAYEKVIEQKENREIAFSRMEQLDFAMNDAIFRRIVPGEPIPRDILQFSWKKNDDGSVERTVRWVSNELGLYKGEETWLKRKLVFVPWEMNQNEQGQYVVKIVDEKYGESLNLVLEKSVVEPGKPAQWSLTDSKNDMAFNDYFTGFCDGYSD